MAGELSPADAELIDGLCREFRRWAPDAAQQPTFERLLPGGYSNTTALIANTSQRWVLSISSVAGAARGSRGDEAAIQRLAAAAGLAPPLRYHDPQRGVLITDHLDGRRDDISDPIRLAQLLRDIHALPLMGERVHTPDLLLYYHAQLPQEHALARLLQAQESIQRATAMLETGEPPAPVLCHNDLLRANRLLSHGRLIALDWEYAAPGDPFFELAVCASELTPQQSQRLLDAYLKRPANVGEQKRFAAQRLLYAAIEACWHAQQHPRSHAELAATERLREALQDGAQAEVGA